jgi:hypothetical protein
MFAQGKGMITCADPGGKTKTGERTAPGCVQPGTETVTLGGVELEFCKEHVKNYESS